jgi:glyoxylase-like metal-dependent hydrolase (beta-lactamase superfamily II)
MKARWYVVFAAAVALAGCAREKTAATVLQDAQSAMGTVTTIEYSGNGNNGFVGQALLAGETWPQRPMTSYTRSINYDQQASKEVMNFAEPVFGGQMQENDIRGDKAWNVGPMGPAPAPATVEDRQLSLLMTPHGFLKAAAAAGAGATLAAGQDSNVITFKALNKYTVEGTLDAQNHVTRVKTTVGNPVLGDTERVAEYSGYKAYNGVQFPSKIVVNEGGFPAWDLNITNVTPGATVDLTVPSNAASATVPPVQTMVNKLGDGVWHITGGSHHSVVVEFPEYIAVIEAPLNEERSKAVLAQAKMLVPNKPVRYLLTTHHHFDHTGGLRTYVAEGATIVTHQSNVPYFQKTTVAPATIVPDAQSNNPKQPMFQGVSDKFELSGGKQKIEVYATDGDTHTKEYTLIYLPGPRVLVEADAYSPGPADAPPPTTPQPNAVKLWDEVQKLKLNVATIAPIHGRGAVPFAEFKKFVGK